MTICHHCMAAGPAPRQIRSARMIGGQNVAEGRDNALPSMPMRCKRSQAVASTSGSEPVARVERRETRGLICNDEKSAPGFRKSSIRATAQLQYPGAFSIWSNQSKPISLTMRLEITISRASDVA